MNENATTLRHEISRDLYISIKESLAMDLYVFSSFTDMEGMYSGGNPVTTTKWAIRGSKLPLIEYSKKGDSESFYTFIFTGEEL